MSFNGNSSYGSCAGNIMAAFADGGPRHPVPVWELGAWAVQDRGDI